MKHKEMVEALTKQAETLSSELQFMDKEFAFKKEQYLKTLGALEALNQLEPEEEVDGGKH